MTLLLPLHSRVVTVATFVVAVGLVTSLDQAVADPPVVEPGPPPGDAVVLFDGKDLSRWKAENGGEARWLIQDGAMVVNGTGSVVSREEFGDCQLHVEWATPAEARGEGQERGNSGVYLQGRYEIQVLDSYGSKTYPDGQAGAFYGHRPPLVNVCRKPGEWQTYDIVFHPPRVEADGTRVSGSFTVFQNGILVQDHIPIPGKETTAALLKGVSPTGPLVLQDHGNPVRYRNIWVRRLQPVE